MSAFTPALRSSLLYLSKQQNLRRWMETSPQAARLTRRFVAGNELEDALQVAGRLHRAGTLTSLDHLGENVRSLDEAEHARDAYLQALDSLAALGIGATISVKVTSLGLDISENACFDNLAALVDRAAETHSCVETDMESSEYTDRTLALVHAMQNRRPGAVRSVIQAYLFRSKADIEALNRAEIPVRLCKGAYQESPTIAWQGKSEVDASYERLTDLLLEGGTYPAFATHDVRMLDYAINGSRRRGQAPDTFEFQMLYGVRRDVQRAVLQNGFRLRLYVPYGTAWYPYFMRRIAERPANMAFVLRNLVS